MIYVLFSIGCLFTFICYKEKRRLDAGEKTKTVGYAFVTNALEVLIPFTGVTLLYAILTYSLTDMGSDHLTLETLRQYESRVQWVQGKLKFFKLGSFYSFLLLGVWFIVALLVRHRLNNGGERLEKAYAKYETYNKWVKRVSVVVTLLAAFTFFGNQVDGLDGKLQAQIMTVKGNYIAYALKVEKAVKDSVANETHKRIVASAPTRYSKAVSISQQTSDRYSTAANRYRSTRVDYQYQSPKFEKLESQAQRQEDVVGRMIADAEKTAEVPRGVAPDADSHAKSISLSNLKRLNESLDRYAADLASRAEPVLKTPLGKKLIPSVLGVLITHENIQALDSLAGHSPILKAILPVFSKTLSKKVELHTNEAIQRLAAKAVTQPQINFEQEIKAVAEPIVKEVIVEWNATPEPMLKLLEVAVQVEEAEVARASAEVNSRYEAKHADLVNENRKLLSRVNQRWQEKINVYASDPMPQLRSFLNKPSTSDLQRAFDDFTSSVKATADPVEQHKIIESTLEVLNKSPTIEQSVVKLAGLAEAGFPVALHGFSRIERSMRPPIQRLPSPSVAPYYGGGIGGRPGPARPTYRPRSMPRR